MPAPLEQESISRMDHSSHILQVLAAHPDCEILRHDQIIPDSA